jgi:hypothetical protein
MPVRKWLRSSPAFLTELFARSGVYSAAGLPTDSDVGGLIFGFGVALAFAAIIMAFAPWTRTAYAIGVLVYAFFVGTSYAAYSALVVHAIGRGVASTKYAICQSLGNIPVAYMTAFNGWVHDRYGGVWMLNGEALLALACIAAGLIVLQRINASRVSVSSSIAVLP